MFNNDSISIRNPETLARMLGLGPTDDGLDHGLTFFNVTAHETDHGVQADADGEALFLEVVEALGSHPDLVALRAAVQSAGRPGDSTI